MARAEVLGRAPRNAAFVVGRAGKGNRERVKVFPPGSAGERGELRARRQELRSDHLVGSVFHEENKEVSRGIATHRDKGTQAHEQPSVSFEDDCLTFRTCQCEAQTEIPGVTHPEGEKVEVERVLRNQRPLEGGRHGHDNDLLGSPRSKSAKKVHPLNHKCFPFMVGRHSP